MNLKELIHQQPDHFSETEKEILAFMLEHEQKIGASTITSLAEQVHVSKSSILRLTKKLGFSGYSELKYFMKASVTTPDTNRYDVLENQQKDLANTLKYLEQAEWTPLLKKIQQAKIVYCYGTGYAQKNAVSEFSKSLLGCGKRSLVLPARTEFDVSLSAFTKEDLVLIASLSGETEEMKEDIKLLKLRQIPFVSVTTFNQNYIASLATYSLYYHVTPMSMKGSPRELHSFITLNLVLDTLVRRYLLFMNQQEAE